MVSITPSTGGSNALGVRPPVDERSENILVTVRA